MYTAYNGTHNAHAQPLRSGSGAPKPFYLESLNPQNPQQQQQQQLQQQQQAFQGHGVNPMMGGAYMAPYGAQQMQPFYAPQQQQQQQMMMTMNGAQALPLQQQYYFAAAPQQMAAMPGGGAPNAMPALGYGANNVDMEEPLPFPPSHLIAEYPPEFQQQLIVYYHQMRRIYPDLYAQYCEYYSTYYEPLYDADKAADQERREREQAEAERERERQRMERQLREAEEQERRRREHQDRCLREKQQREAEARRRREVENQQRLLEEQQRRLAEQRQQELQSRNQQQALLTPSSAKMNQPQQGAPTPSASSNAGRDVGGELTKKSSTLSRQSNIRRQNSIRRMEVNQQKNEGSLRRLPSMRQS